MSIVQIAKSAAVRYVVYAALALAFGYFGVGRASAHTPSQCQEQSGAGACSKAEADGAARAYSSAQQHCDAYLQAKYHTGFADLTYTVDSVNEVNAGNSSPGVPHYFNATYSAHWPNGASESCGIDNFYFLDKVCAVNDPPLSGGGWVEGDWAHDTSMPGSVCSDGCMYDQPSTPATISCVDGQCWTKTDGFTAAGLTCTPGTPEEGDAPPVDTDKDGHSDGNDPKPNNPGTNGSTDEDGDGATSAGGGASCSSPPSVTGDAGAAMIAYQTWATRCAIENAKDGNGNLKTTQGDGSGSGTGGGGGTGMECGMGTVNQAICATKGYAQKLSDFVDGLTDHSGDLDTDQGEEQDPQDVWQDAPTQADLDSNGFGWGSSCPAPPEYMGHSLDVGGNLCMLAGIIGAFVLLGAYAQAAYIIGRS